VPTELADKAEALFEGNVPDSAFDQDDLVIFVFHEVNYGTLDFLQDLRKHGIAYDSSWEDGGEYEAGTDSCRFTPEGGMNLSEVYDSQLSIPIDDLMKIIDHPNQLKQWIVNASESVAVLPWDNQVEYGKLHLSQLP
jgi:hypothetical protein